MAVQQQYIKRYLQFMGIFHWVVVAPLHDTYIYKYPSSQLP